MISEARNLLRSNLSPETFREIRFRWWLGRSYLNGLTAPLRSLRHPNIQAFPAGANSRLAEQLREAEVFVPTEMCRIMSRHGSDKGSTHNYTTVYSVLFAGRRSEPLRILEVGLGTNNPHLASSMGTAGKPGASMRGWRELFPYASIYGADIDRDILFEEERIQTFYCDQLDPEAIASLWSMPQLRGGIDVIIDDGLHTFEANDCLMERSLQNLRPGGIYVVEDILKEALPDWRRVLEQSYPARFPGHEFILVELPHAYNRHDNNMVIVRRD
jgi:SAM-dependent methyltransferase